MSKKYDIDYLHNLINEEEEENLHLDYKAAHALGKTDGKKAEISKDVSAMANSDGGVIIYGISEFKDKDSRYKPEKIDPVRRGQFSKEWLEQVINSNIQPKVKNIIITPVSISESDVVFVVKIPKSDTAHQAKDKRYYKRYNFESVPMEDYEVKDILNRAKYPKIVMDFRFIKEFDKNAGLKNARRKYTVTLEITCINNGSIFANYINYFIHLPDDLINDSFAVDLPESEKYENYLVISGDNTYQELIPQTKQTQSLWSRSNYIPLLPGVKKTFNSSLTLKNDFPSDEREIYWTVFADNAPPQEGKVKIKDIPFHIINGNNHRINI